MTLAPDTTYSAYMSWTVQGKAGYDKALVRGVKAADGKWGQTKNMKIQEVPSKLKAKSGGGGGGAAGGGFIPGLTMPISIVVVVVAVVVLAAIMAIICCCCCMKKEEGDASNKVTALD